MLFGETIGQFKFHTLHFELLALDFLSPILYKVVGGRVLE